MIIGDNLRHLRFGGRGVGVVAVDIRGRWWFPWRCLRKGRRVRRPYTDLSNPRCLDASHWYPFRSSAGRHRHNRRKSAVWCWRCRWSRSTFGVDGRSSGRCLRTGRRMRRPYTDLSNLPGLRCRVGARCVSLQGVVSIIVTGRQLFRWRCLQPGRRVASPLHRFIEFTGPEMPRRRPLRFSAGRRQHHRDGSTIVPLEVFTAWATRASPLHRFIEPTVPGMPTSAPVPFLCECGNREKRDSLVQTMRRP